MENIGQLAYRIHVLERKVDMIMQHLGIEFEDNGLIGIPDEVVAHIKSGNVIGAIKVYREYTGTGLKEAKDVIDGLMGRHKQGLL